MVIDWTLVSGYALAAAFGGFSLFTYSRAQTLRTFLTDAAKRFELGKRAYHELEKEFGNSEQQIAQLQITVSKYESALDEARSMLANKNREIDSMDQSKRDALREAELEIDNLTLHAQDLKQQLSEFNNADRSNNDQTIVALQEEVSTLKSQNEGLKKKAEAALHDNGLLTTRIDKMEKFLGTVDAAEINRIKKRAQTLEQLYKSMKGLRELAEERSHNWEIALTQLANHVLKQEGVKLLPTHTFGQKVAMALEKIGGALIQDDFNMVTPIPVEEEIPMPPPKAARGKSTLAKRAKTRAEPS